MHCRHSSLEPSLLFLVSSLAYSWFFKLALCVLRMLETYAGLGKSGASTRKKRRNEARGRISVGRRRRRQRQTREDRRPIGRSSAYLGVMVLHNGPVLFCSRSRRTSSSLSSGISCSLGPVPCPFFHARGSCWAGYLLEDTCKWRLAATSSTEVTVKVAHTETCSPQDVLRVSIGQCSRVLYIVAFAPSELCSCTGFLFPISVSIPFPSTGSRITPTYYFMIIKHTKRVTPVRKNTTSRRNEHVESHTSYVQDKTTGCLLLCKKRGAQKAVTAQHFCDVAYSVTIRLLFAALCIVARKQAGNMQLHPLYQPSQSASLLCRTCVLYHWCSGAVAVCVV